MTIKKEYLILAALIVALSLYVYFRQQDRTHYELPVLEEVPPSEIVKIEISKAQALGVTLTRQEEGWALLPEAYPADPAKVTVMLETLRNLTLSALISESKSYERYGLGAEDKINVKAWASEGLRRDLEIGKEAPSLQHTFVKIGGDDRVFQARENLRVRFDQTLDGLRDKSVLTFNAAEVDAVELYDGETSLRLTRKQDPGQEDATRPSWESPEGPVDEGRVNDLLSTLSNLKCRAYIYEQVKDDFRDPAYKVTLEGVEESSLALFAKDGENLNDHPAISSQSGFPFLLPDHQVERIMVPLDQIVKPQ